jgi:ribosome-associated heat shock protein Hsp15
MAVRVDKWLWAVRVYKTRTKASAACDDGRVLVNDVAAKPATRVGDRTLIHVVVEPIEKRVSAPRAAECIDDRSPPPVPLDRPGEAVFARRERGTGRPTKRDRREIERLRGRDRRP